MYCGSGWVISLHMVGGVDVFDYDWVGLNEK